MVQRDSRGVDDTGGDLGGCEAVLIFGRQRAYNLRMAFVTNVGGVDCLRQFVSVRKLA